MLEVPDFVELGSGAREALGFGPTQNVALVDLIRAVKRARH